ncbi:uncharacterized protein LOC135393204 [Ornithodoros turicata]|uniref:uncharacterized protein LOC135393204 n=1 Tax=Ornithodoros turicata TaxID=34597 RepID=UPI003139CFE0
MIMAVQMLPIHAEVMEKLASTVTIITSHNDVNVSRKNALIATVAAGVATKYISHVNLLLQMMERQCKLLQMLILLRKRRRAFKIHRSPTYCCQSVKNLLLDYLRDETLDFDRHFRISRRTFHRLRQLVGGQSGSTGWTTDIELLIFLHWLSAGASYRAISNTFGIPRTSAHNIVYRYVDDLVSRIRDVIRVPQTQEHLEAICTGFASLCRTSGPVSRVAGVIDSCSVQPSTGDATVQMQAVCDHEGRFLDFSVGYPSSFSPGEVFRASPFYENAAYPPTEGCFLIGGEGYPCLVKPVPIMAPFPEPTKTDVETAFNTVCRRAIAVLHEAFVQLTGRWKAVFERCLKVLPRRTAKVVAVCALIHNICLEEDDVWKEGRGLEVVLPTQGSQGDADTGVALRELLAQQAADDALRTFRVSLDHDYWLDSSFVADHDYIVTNDM